MDLFVEGLPINTTVVAHYYEDSTREDGEGWSYYQRVELQNGKNTVNLSGETIDKLKFVIWSNPSNNYQFCVVDYRLWEMPPGTLLNSIGWFLLFVFGCLLAQNLIRMRILNNNVFVNSQHIFFDAYLYICDSLITRRKKECSFIRSFVWLLLLVYIHFASITNAFLKDDYNLRVLGICFFLLIEACLYRIENNITVKVDVTYFKLFFLFAITLTISNLVVSKSSFRLSGFFALFSATFLGFSLASSIDTDNFFSEINIAVLVHFILISFFSFLLREKTSGIMYNGPFLNAHEFAYYLLVVSIVLLVGVFYYMNRSYIKTWDAIMLMLNIIMLFVVGVFALYCHENLVSSLLLVFSIVTFFVIVHFQNKTREREWMLKRVLILCAGCVIGVATLFLSMSILDSGSIGETDKNYLASILNLYREETLEKSYTIWRLGWNKLFEYKKLIISKQLQIWKIAFFKYNLVGHSSNLKIWGHRVEILNGYVKLLYRYGCIPGILFITLVVESVVLSIRKCKDNISASNMMQMYIVLSFAIINVFSYVETPFSNVLWVSFFVVGSSLVFRVKE